MSLADSKILKTAVLVGLRALPVLKFRLQKAGGLVYFGEITFPFTNFHFRYGESEPCRFYLIENCISVPAKSSFFRILPVGNYH